MVTLKMESGAKPQVPDTTTTVNGASAALRRTQIVNSVLQSQQHVRQEIDDILEDIKIFKDCEPDQVFNVISAHSARLVEIITQIVRIEVVQRDWKPYREEAERVQAELKFQFQLASRQMAMRQLDWDMSGRGQV